jgi:hypothetical protein
MKRGGGDHASTSRFLGVCWNKNANKWQAVYKRKHLGLHTTDGGSCGARIQQVPRGWKCGSRTSTLLSFEGRQLGQKQEQVEGGL